MNVERFVDTDPLVYVASTSAEYCPACQTGGRTSVVHPDRYGQYASA